MANYDHRKDICMHVSGCYFMQQKTSYFTFISSRIRYTGFARVLENLESPGILFWHLPGLESPGRKPLVLKSSRNLLNLNKKLKSMEGSKENWHWDLGSVGVNVNFRAHEKSIWVLEKSWFSPGNLFLKKSTNPVVLRHSFKFSFVHALLVSRRFDPAWGVQAC